MQKIVIEDKKTMHSSEQEAYKALRTNILCCSNTIKVILFTSAEPGAGKTTISYEVAVSLAEIDKKVLYLDCDMRKAGLISRYQLNGKVNGLTQYLANGQLDWTDFIYETNISNFYLTFSGPIPKHPTELLEVSRFHRFMSLIKEKFDYVIVDSPALGTVIDSVIIAKECDGAILIESYENGKKKKLRKALEQLQKSGVEIMGAVLNKMPEKAVR